MRYAWSYRRRALSRNSRVSALSLGGALKSPPAGGRDSLGVGRSCARTSRTPAKATSAATSAPPSTAGRRSTPSGAGAEGMHLDGHAEDLHEKQVERDQRGHEGAERGD